MVSGKITYSNVSISCLNNKKRKTILKFELSKYWFKISQAPPSILSNIEISFSPPYFAQIDSVKKFKFSRWDITWSEYSCNHCQHHPTFYLLSFITIRSSIFKKASFHIIPLISHQARHVFFTSFIFKPYQNIGEMEVLIRPVRSFDQNEMRGRICL